MDVAYDHIQEEAVSPEEAKNKQLGEGDTVNNLNTEVREAYKAFSASPWGAKLGGIWGSVKKQVSLRNLPRACRARSNLNDT